MWCSVFVTLMMADCSRHLLQYLKRTVVQIHACCYCFLSELNIAAGKDVPHSNSASSQWVEQKDDLIQPISGFAIAVYRYLCVVFCLLSLFCHVDHIRISEHC